jgi:hypothetical protein
MLLFDPTPAVEWINFSIKSIDFSDDLLFFPSSPSLLPAAYFKIIIQKQPDNSNQFSRYDCSCCSVCIIHI